jgi:hypothetical protein
MYYGNIPRIWMPLKIKLSTSNSHGCRQVYVDREMVASLLLCKGRAGDRDRNRTVVGSRVLQSELLGLFRQQKYVR